MAERSRKQPRAAARAGQPTPDTVRPGSAPWTTPDGPHALAAAVLICDLSGTILDVNAQARALLGVERRGILGRSVLSAGLWGDGAVAPDGAPLDPTGWLKDAVGAGDGPRRDLRLGLRREGEDALTWLHAGAERLQVAPSAAASLVITLYDVTALKETCDALERTTAELGTALAAVPDVYIYLDAEDRVTRVAGHWRLGSSVSRLLSDDVEGKLPWDYIVGDAAPRVRQAVALTRATGQPVTTELAFRTSTGPRFEEARQIPTTEDGVLVIVRDVTERKRAEEALKHSEDKYRTLYTRTPVMLHSIDAQGRLVSVSDRWLERLGYDAAEVIGHRSTDFLSEESRRYAAEEVLPEFFRTGECADVPYQMIAKDGRLVDVLLSATAERDDSGHVGRSLAVLIDVGAQKAAEAAAVENARVLGTLMANLPGMAYRCQAVAPWQDEFIGAACLETTGYTADQLIAGTPVWEEVMEPADRELLSRETRDAIATRRHGELEYRIHTASGGLRWIWDRFHIVRDENDAPVALEGLMLDVTDRHLAEEQLKASRRELQLHERIATVFLTRPPDEMFGEVLDVVREALASRWGFFGYVAEDGDLVAPSLTREIWEACQVEGKDLRFPRETWGDNLWARALTDGTTQVLDGDGTVPKGHLPIDRAIAVPLAFHGETIGIFIVANPDVKYSDDDVRLLESSADYTAPVLHEWLQRASAENARLSAEESLRKSESLYRTLFQQAPVGVVLYDALLVILDCNESFARMVGATREQLVGLDLTTSPDARPLDALRRPLAGAHGVYEGPYTATVTGRELWISLKTAPRSEADGKVSGAVAVVTDRTSQRSAKNEMERLRLQDSVTGLPNRLLFADRVAQALAHAQRKRLGFAVAAMAIDRFSSLVDTLGHEACDRLLAAAAERLSATMRTEDTVACLAGSEFGLLLAGVGGPAQASASVEKTIAAFAHPFQVAGHELFLNLSLGVAVYPADGADPQDLIENAEVAARRASSAGGNGWQFFHASMNDERAGKLALEGELHRALEREQFVLHYQPIVQADNGEVIGLEALLRWNRPGNGLVQPLEFIPVAEEIGLMVPIGAWALHTACAQAQAWSRLLGRPLNMAVNLSARQLYEGSLAATVRAALKDSHLPARQLELEITETAAMRDPQQAGRIVNALTKRHVRIALDDFGTGYSSLSHLVRLPIAAVKIDRSFVRDLLSVPEHAAVAASVIALGHRLGLTVVAEGVETHEEREFLRDEGCDALQGYLFSRPLPPEECTAMLEAGPIVP